MALVEFMVAITIGTLVVAAMMSVFAFSGRSFAAMANYTDLDKQSRNALDRMSREIRKTISLTSFATNQLVLKDFDNTPLTYSYNPQSRKLTRTKETSTEELLKECDTFTFSIYQRNPIGGTYDQYPTATPATCKLIQMKWVCSRTILGAKVNTESVQSAKVVIRNEQ